jgi:hypothetical protein
MKNLRASGIVSSLAAVSLATASLLVPDSADATEALFRVLRAWYGGDNWTATYYLPKDQGPDKAPPAPAQVGATTITGQPAQKFTFPRGTFLSTNVTWYCKPGTCAKGYPVSGGIYAQTNARGTFRPNNPYGATTTTTIRFPTTMSSTAPPSGMGNPRTPTTTFPFYRWNNYTTGGSPTPYATYQERGNYDFSRGGSIRVTPGEHRFGGTMRYFWGGGFWYQYITISSPYVSTALQLPYPWQRTTYDESELGEITSGGPLTRYRLTGDGYYKATDGYGDYIYKVAQYIQTAAPWTTGQVRVFQPLGTYVTTLTYSGFDTRTPAGLSGKVSLVRPRLRHTYLRDSDPNVPIRNNWSAARVWGMDFVFFGEAPEPGLVLMLGAGAATLAGLALVRHRKR